MTGTSTIIVNVSKLMKYHVARSAKLIYYGDAKLHNLNEDDNVINGRYLEQFSYKIDLKENIWIFLTAMVISIAISTAAVLWQTIRAARTNPAEALKKE